jgi:predicted phosphodiesterase
MSPQLPQSWSAYFGLRNCYALYDYLVGICPTRESVVADIFTPLQIPAPSLELDISVEDLIIHAIEECRARGDIVSLLTLASQVAPFGRGHADEDDHRARVLEDLIFDRGQASVTLVSSRRLNDIDTVCQEYAVKALSVDGPAMSTCGYCQFLDKSMSSSWACIILLDRMDETSCAQGQSLLELAIHHALSRGLYVHLLVSASEQARKWSRRVLPPARQEGERSNGGSHPDMRVTCYGSGRSWKKALVKLLKETLRARALGMESYAESGLRHCGCGPASDEAFVIAHMSDLHLGEADVADGVWRPVHDDIQGLGYADKIKFLILSGDITGTGSANEFDVAAEFVRQAQRELHLPAEHIVVVPGNHDLSWDQPVYDWAPRRNRHSAFDACGAVPFCRGGLVQNKSKYPLRFRTFADFYWKVFSHPYSLVPERQVVLHECSKHRIRILALNSSYQIDEYFQTRAGLCDRAIDAGLKMKQESEVKSIFDMAVWHHPLRDIANAAVLERFAQKGFLVCLHGHLHEPRQDMERLSPHGVLNLLGAGSLHAAAADRPEGTPQLYHLLEVRPGKGDVVVHTRSRPRPSGAWGKATGLSIPQKAIIRLRLPHGPPA